MFTRGLLSAALVLAALTAFASPASAKQPQCKAIDQSQDVAYNSNTSADPLGAAIAAAAPGDTLKVMGTCYGTFSILKDLTIRGRSSSQHEDAIFGTVLTAADVTLSDLTIHGSVDNEFDLALVRTTVTDSSRSGIFNGRDSLTLDDSTVSGNAGAGIFQSFGGVAIHNSRVTGNGGAGIDVHHGAVRIYDSLVDANRGGGIETGAFVLLSHSVVEGNSTTGVGGGVGSFDVGHVEITGSTIRGNTAAQGGGIYNAPMTFGETTITDSLITGNRATGGAGGIAGQGGGIYNGAKLSLANSSVTGNSARAAGGGIFNSGMLALSGTNVLCANTPDDWPGCLP